MNRAKTPRSLRSNAAMNSVCEKFDDYSGRKVSTVAGLMAVASFSGAEAQQSIVAAGDGRCPGRPPASCRLKTIAGSDQRAQCAAARRASFAACAGCAGAVSQRRRAERRPRPLCGCGRALQGRSPAGLGQISRTIAEHAEDRHGAQQGSAGGRERHVVEAGGPEHRRRDARDRRGRQRLWRPLLRSRLRYPQ